MALDPLLPARRVVAAMAHWLSWRKQMTRKAQNSKMLAAP
ncbi:hypothetical protein CCACVL1_11099 [Corchorus capsularis]|uniref:Uncharacterized protein n=1 Tax=Corchorus capsularis TaxID=210143 RepID=A0A1R3IMU3_COCAP|nr:hypothetical protein CCACVL1_11099 [Corchorus capsularis]